MKERTELSMQLYHILVDRGYPEALCDLIICMSHAQSRRKACVGACSQEHALRLDCIRRRRT